MFRRVSIRAVIVTVKQVLPLLKEKKYPIRASVEYEYRGTATPMTLTLATGLAVAPWSSHHSFD